MWLMYAVGSAFFIYIVFKEKLSRRSALGLVAVVTGTLLMLVKGGISLELAVLDFIQQNLRCDFMDNAMVRLTTLGNGGLLWIVAAGLLLIFPKTRRVGLTVAFSLIIEALMCNVLIKPWVARVRPFDVNTTAQLLIAPPADYSFPSGHTGAAFATAAGLYFARHSLWLPTTILGAIMGFSRLYLYVHYPSDVLCGAMLGVACGWLGSRASRCIAK